MVYEYTQNILPKVIVNIELNAFNLNSKHHSKYFAYIANMHLTLPLKLKFLSIIWTLVDLMVKIRRE